MRYFLIVLAIFLAITSPAGEDQQGYREFFPLFDNDIRYRAGRILAKVGDKSSVPVFISVLNDTDEKIRIMAIEALVKFRAKDALPELVSLLDDLSPEIRIRTLEALASLGNKDIINKILPLLKDENETVRTKAKTTLKCLGYKFPKKSPPKYLPPSHEESKYPSKKPEKKPSVGKLMNNLRYGDDEAKIFAMKELLRLKETSAISLISTRLNTYRSQKVLREAVKTLSEFGDKRSIPYMVDVLDYVNAKTALCILETIINIDKDASIPFIIKEGFNSKYPEVRIASAACMGKNRIKKASKGLKKLLKDKNPEVRKAACTALGGLRDSKAVPQLCAMAGDSDKSVRMAAISALGASGKDALPRLVKLMSSSNAKERAAILNSMAEIGTESVISYLLEGLNDSEYDIRLASAKGLGKFAHENALIPLVETVLIDPEKDIRLAAEKSLKKYNSETIEDILISQLENEDTTIRRRAIEFLGKAATKPAVPCLKDFFEQASMSEKKLLVGTLSESQNSSGLEIFLMALDENDRFMKVKAIEALPSIMGKECEPHLVKMLKDDDIRVRCSAARKLSGYGNTACIDTLIFALKDEYADVRNSAERALLKIGDISIAPRLAPILKDEHYRFRYYATVSLNDIYGSRKAVPLLVKDIESEDPWIRYAAFKALCHFADPSTKNALKTAINQGDSLSRAMAARTLGAIAGKQKDAEIIELLGIFLEDRNAKVRCETAEALGKTTGAKAKELLMKMLKDPEEEVRYTAAFSLGQLTEPKAIPILCEALKSGNVEIRLKAARAFYYTCNKETIHFLKQALSDKSPLVRTAASRALRKWSR